MDVHVLNGDALGEKFSIAGEVIICREALIEGPVTATGEQFWKERARHLASNNIEETTYFVDVKSEFEKLLTIKEEETLNLWFEHDLFCQVNLWFVLHYIHSNNINIPVFVVMPPIDQPEIWSGFGRMRSSGLQQCFHHRKEMTKQDILLGATLWNNFSKNDLDGLKKLSNTQSVCFPLLKEVITAHVDRFPLHSGRPQKRLRELQLSGLTDFHDIFKEFSKTEGIYGFGDLQVKQLLTSL